MMPSGWFGRDNEPKASAPSAPESAPHDTTHGKTATSAPPAPTRHQGEAKGAATSPEPDYEATWSRPPGPASGVSGAKVKPVGAPDLAIGESSAAAAARGADKSSKRYRQMIVVGVFVLLAALAAAVASVFLGNNNEEVADARIDDTATERTGDTDADDPGDPVPAQVAEESTTTAPDKSKDGEDGGDSKRGSSDSESSDGESSSADSDVEDEVAALAQAAAGKAAEVGRVSPVATVRIEDGKYVSDQASTSLEDTKPIALTVGSFFTVQAEPGVNPNQFHHIQPYNFDLETQKVSGDDGSVIALAQSDGAITRWQAKAPGAAIVALYPAGDDGLQDPVFFVILVS